jgi:hypothetical protein
MTASNPSTWPQMSNEANWRSRLRDRCCSRCWASWAEIGDALGVSRQSAWEYFTRRLRSDLSANVGRSDLTEDEAMELVVEEVRATHRGRSG